MPDQFSLIVFLSVAFTFVFCFWMTKKLITSLSKRAILDIPNARSSHTLPTPRGAGWAIVISQIILWPILHYTSFNQSLDSLSLNMLIAVLLISLISWKDDLKPLSARSRFLVQTIAAILILLTFSENLFFFQGTLPYWVDRALILFLYLGWINIFNFMDGIDGITGQQSIIMCLAFAALFYALGEYSFSLYSLNIAVACFAFLLWNWRPARIFLGDVGSIFLGLITGWFILLLLSKGQWAAALIIPAYYYADGGITLLKRIIQRKNIFKPHQEHFYQMPVHHKVPADKICRTISIANIFLSFLGLYSYAADMRVICLIVTPIILMTLLIKLKMMRR